jgi:hypothetical protein
VVIATAMVGNRDDSGDVVPAGQWAQSVCGSIGVWRGQIEAIVEDIRTPPATGATGTEEPQSETPQGRTGLVRTGLERAVDATETLVEGIDNAGIPATTQGDEVAQQVSDWADASLNDLEKAQDSLEEEADTQEEALAQFTGAASSIRTVLATGFTTLLDVATSDPELSSAINQSSTCVQLRQERGSE